MDDQKLNLVIYRFKEDLQNICQIPIEWNDNRIHFHTYDDYRRGVELYKLMQEDLVEILPHDALFDVDHFDISFYEKRR